MKAGTLALLLTIGCGAGTTVSGTVVHPAAMPVRSFPRIWIAGGHLDHEVLLLDALAHHLRGERAEAGAGGARARGPGVTADVRRVELDDLEPLRVANRIPPATVVLILDLRFREGTRSEWASRPETVCGPVGCYTTQRSYMYELPTLLGTLSIAVYDGPTARVLQRLRLREADEGRGYDEMRERVTIELRERLLASVDQRRDRVEVVLLEVDVPEVVRAIEVIDGGDWSAGRRLLDDAWRAPAVRALPPEDRARVLYDIGQARRFDPATLDDPDEHFAAAERAFRAAIRLDPESRYENALRALRRHRSEVVVARAQEEAAEHNYRMAGSPAEPSPSVPAPPPSYEE